MRYWFIPTTIYEQCFPPPSPRKFPDRSDPLIAVKFHTALPNHSCRAALHPQLAVQRGFMAGLGETTIKARRGFGFQRPGTFLCPGMRRPRPSHGCLPCAAAPPPSEGGRTPQDHTATHRTISPTTHRAQTPESEARDSRRGTPVFVVPARSRPSRRSGQAPPFAPPPPRGGPGGGAAERGARGGSRWAGPPCELERRHRELGGRARRHWGSGQPVGGGRGSGTSPLPVPRRTRTAPDVSVQLSQLPRTCGEAAAGGGTSGFGPTRAGRRLRNPPFPGPGPGRPSRCFLSRLPQPCGGTGRVLWASPVSRARSRPWSYVKQRRRSPSAAPQRRGRAGRCPGGAGRSDWFCSGSEPPEAALPDVRSLLRGTRGCLQFRSRSFGAGVTHLCVRCDK